MTYSFPVLIIITLVAVLGFALFFNVDKRHIAAAVIGGVITWMINYFFYVPGTDPFIACMVASLFAAVYAEAAARITRTPTAAFFIVSVIPLIPGRALYYTMYYLVRGNFDEFFNYGIMALEYAAGIAVGICLVTAAVQTWDAWAADKVKRLARIARKAARSGNKPNGS